MYKCVNNYEQFMNEHKDTKCINNCEQLMNKHKDTKCIRTFISVNAKSGGVGMGLGWRAHAHSHQTKTVSLPLFAYFDAITPLYFKMTKLL